MPSLLKRWPCQAAIKGTTSTPSGPSAKSPIAEQSQDIRSRVMPASPCARALTLALVDLRGLTSVWGQRLSQRIAQNYRVLLTCLGGSEIADQVVAAVGNIGRVPNCEHKDLLRKQVAVLHCLGRRRLDGVRAVSMACSALAQQKPGRGSAHSKPSVNQG